MNESELSLRVFFISRTWIKMIPISVLLIAGILLWNGKGHQTITRIHDLTVLIDPGHGGIDAGSQDAEGNLEKDINLAISLKIYQEMKESGLNVVLTRTSDIDLAPYSPGKSGRHRRDLMARLKKGRDYRCDFWISIHCDWSPNAARRGACVFYNPFEIKSKNLAVLIQNELNILQQKSVRIIPGNFVILRQNGIGAVLIEAGFLSNPKEAAKLRDDNYCRCLAAAISKGILNGCRQLSIQGK